MRIRPWAPRHRGDSQCRIDSWQSSLLKELTALLQLLLGRSSIPIPCCMQPGQASRPGIWGTAQRIPPFLYICCPCLHAEVQQEFIAKCRGAGKEKEGENIISCLSLFCNVFMWKWKGGPGASLCISFEMPFFHKQKGFRKRMLSRTEK